jgi:uncharacterized protein (DUF362 family)/NAD-dependent dihydropyrimidine dehydrogenase PreA subunit
LGGDEKVPKVAIIGCETYHYDMVKAAVERGIALLGGAGIFARRGEKILLKPNLLSAVPPEKCVTTHPALFKAVAEALMTTGAKLSYGDSPALGNTAGAAKKCGLQAVADELDIGLADFKTGVEIFFEEGRQNRKFVIAKGVLDSDGVVSLPKLKTHGLEKFTGCVKNQFGCIPGVLKGEYHVKVPDAWDFGKMLVDLNRFVNPRLYIMDGIEAMEGNGPRSGRPRRMNMLLFSEDPVALDATVLRLIGLNPKHVPTTKFGSEFGAGTYDEKDIELVGDNFDDFKIPDFDIDRTPALTSTEGGFARFMGNRLVSRPVIVKEKCVTCGICVEMCPAHPKAVDWFDDDTSRPPTYNYDSCIRCYCCQEVCPEGAIELKAPIIRKLLGPVIG